MTKEKDAEYSRRYRARHPDRVRATNQRWRAADPENAAQVQRKSKLKAKFGLTLEEFNQRIADQGGLCCICYLKPATHVDHCHTTGKVRGILCNNCNRGIGLLGDSAATAHSATKHLLKHLELP